VLDEEAGEGAHARARVADVVQDAQIRGPAVGGDLAPHVPAEPALEESDVRILGQEVFVDPSRRLMPLVVRIVLRFDRATKFLRMRIA
jgi:hypothetical protein